MPVILVLAKKGKAYFLVPCAFWPKQVVGTGEFVALKDQLGLDGQDQEIFYGRDR